MRYSVFDIPSGHRALVRLSALTIKDAEQSVRVEQAGEFRVTLTDDFKVVDGAELRRGVDVSPSVPMGEIWLSDAPCEYLRPGSR